MTCDLGALRAYLDDEDLPAEHAAMDAHLAGCAPCRDELKSLRQQSLLMDSLLPELEPSERIIPEPEAALAQFRWSQAEAGTAGLYQQLRGWMNMIGTSFSVNWRRALIGASALAVLLVLFSFAPARQAAADFLGIFRVRKFAAISIDPARAQQLEDLMRSQGDALFGNKTVLREPGEGQPVGSIAEATALAGYSVRTPASTGGATLTNITVQTGPAIRFDIERAGLVALAAAAGLGDVAVPEVETLTLEVDVPTTVVQQLRTGDGGDLVMLQMPSPQATWPEGIDPVAFAEIGLLLLGMSDEDASRLAETIDWTSTVVVPLPTDIGTSSEVTVDGVTGLLLESSGMEPGSEEERMLLWERDGMVYAVVGKWVGARQLLLAADSLQ